MILSMLSFLVFLLSDMVRLAFTDVSKKNYEEFFNLLRTCKVKPSLCLKRKELTLMLENRFPGFKTVATLLYIWRIKLCSLLVNLAII